MLIKKLQEIHRTLKIMWNWRINEVIVNNRDTIVVTALKMENNMSL